MKVCLVTEELSSVGLSGGIGGAFEELALLLNRNGAEVDILHCGAGVPESAQLEAIRRFQSRGIELKFLDAQRHAWAKDAHEARSYAVCRDLMGSDKNYDFIHFHEYHGLGFFSTRAKRQGLAFADTELVVQLHGSTEWCLEANGELPTDADHLKIFHMERHSISSADQIVSPSSYLLQWMNEHDYQLPPEENVQVIHNVCTNVVREISNGNTSTNKPGTRLQIDEIIMFGRHEYRKGFMQFVDGLSMCKDLIASKGIKVTFLGRFGKIAGQHSGAYLARAARAWRFPVQLLPDSNRYEASEYLSSTPNSAVFVPSPFENSPYTVLELLALQKPFMSSVGGGGKELIADNFHDEVLMQPTADGIAEAIKTIIQNGLVIPDLAESLAVTEEKWLEFHNRAHSTETKVKSPKTTNQLKKELPKVVLGITHFERPRKLVDAVMSAARQTYGNLEIVILDDGSKSASTIEALVQLEPVLDRVGAKLIRAENGYLGAARNAIAKATDSEYLCFLDDDDIAHPELIERLVLAAANSQSDIMNCLNVFMPESERGMMSGDPTAFNRPVSYVPLGGPLSLAPIQNVFGAATALIRRSAFEAIGGYTEIKGVGHEDYEFFARISQAGFKIDVTPQPLYLYEVDRPSMISKTLTTSNFRRVVNALEPDKKPEQWRDFFALHSGRIALEHMENRRIWESRKAGYYEIEQPLLTNGTPLQAQLEALIKLSQEVDSPATEQAFELALQGLPGRNNRLGNQKISNHRRIPVSALETNLHDKEFKIAIYEAMGDAENAARGIVDILRSRWKVTTEDWSMLRRFLRMPNTNSSSLNPIRDALKEFDGSGDDLANLQGIQFAIACKTKDVEGMRAAFLTVLEADEMDYLAKQPDVAKAVLEGRLSRGVEHYCRSGVREGRKGFERMGLVLRDAELPVSDDWLPPALLAIAPNICIALHK